MDLTNIERDHQPMMCGCCAGCSVACKHGSGMHVFYPCDATRLLARIRELEAGLREIMDGASEHVPYLLTRVRSLEAGLAKYGQHRPGCPMFASFGSDDRLCECGLAALAGEV